MLLMVSGALSANPAADLDQCANDPAPSLPTDGCTTAAQWVNGNLGGSKAFYREGDSIAYRMRFSNLSLASHTVTIEWDTTKSGKHAIDYLTTFNRTVTTANPCIGVAGCGSSNTFAIPKDPQADNGSGVPITQGSGNFTLYGGTITAVSAYSGGATFPSGDNSRRITITFTASAANPVLAWGGHIAQRRNSSYSGGWGDGLGAVDISGSPFHMRLAGLDGSGGNQDRSLSSDAVTFPGSITIVKDATPNSSTVQFGFTASPSPLTNFTLVDDGTSANTKLFSDIMTFQPYTVSESSIPAGWGFDSVSCAATSNNGGTYSTNSTTVTITMKEGENWTCTYLDSLKVGTLVVKKHVVNDNGGGAIAGNWSIHVKSGANEVPNSPQVGSETGTSYTLNAGSYNVSETGGPSGYSFTGFTGDCDSSGNVTVVAGQEKTCTLTNDDQTAHLKLIKHVTNNDGGTAAATAWTLTADGTGSNDHSGAGGFDQDVNADTYALSESTGPAGYTAGSFDCGAGAVTSVTLAVGQSKTCEITNDDQTAQLKLVKNVEGGPKGADDWTLYASASAPNDGRNFNNKGGSGSLQNVYAGAGYDLSEDPNPGSGYTSTGEWSCNGGSLDIAKNTITLALGEHVTCTITNKVRTFTIVAFVCETTSGTPTLYKSLVTLPAAGGTTKLTAAGPPNGASAADVCGMAANFPNRLVGDIQALISIGDTEATTP
jgi:Prealbumin-like fold domain